MGEEGFLSADTGEIRNKIHELQIRWEIFLKCQAVCRPGQSCYP